MYASRDCDGLTKLWRHQPVAAEGPTGTYYHGVGTVGPLLVVVDTTAFPELGLGQCCPLNPDMDRVIGDGAPRQGGKGW